MTESNLTPDPLSEAPPDFDSQFEYGAKLAEEIARAQDAPFMDAQGTEQLTLDPEGMQAGSPEAPPQPNQLDGDSESDDFDACLFGTFHVAGTEYSLPASQIREVVTFPRSITPVPLSPDFVLGIFNLRGAVIPVLDVALLLGVEPQVELSERRVVVIDCGNHAVGAIFDRTGEVLHVDAEEHHAMRQEPGAPQEGAGGDCMPSAGEIIERVLLLNGGQRLVQVLSPTLLGAVPGIPCSERSSNLDDQRPLDSESRSKAIAVRVGGTEFAFPMEDVLEIQNSLALSTSPAYFHHQSGVVEVRGNLRPVLNLKAAFGQADSLVPEKPLLVSLIEGENCIAVVVDELIDTLEYTESSLLEVPPVPGSQIDGVSRQLIPANSSRNVLSIRSADLFQHCKVGESLKVAGLTHDRQDIDLDEDDAEQDLDYFTFFVGEQRLCLPLGDVREILRFPSDQTLVQDDESPIAGLMNLRGAVLPLSNLSARFGIESTVSLKERLVITIEYGEQMRGLVVDSVESIVHVRASDVSDVSGIMRKTSGSQALLSAVSKVIRAEGTSTSLLMLDLERVVEDIGSSTIPRMEETSPEGGF